MRGNTAEVGIYPHGVVSEAPLRIYTGLLGQIGDIVMFTPTARRIKELFPNSQLTFAVSQRYAEVGELIVGLPYVDRLFVTQCYFERLTPELFQPWERGWPVDLRGDDERAEHARHDLVFETRPRHSDPAWWEHRHLAEELAYAVGVPGPIDLTTDISLPPNSCPPPQTAAKIVLHNDPTTDARKGWPWEHLLAFVRQQEAAEIVLIGRPGPEVPGVLDLRGKTTLVEAAAIIAACRCYVGVESGPLCIAGSLQVPVVGLYGTEYRPTCGAFQPRNPRAAYLQAEGPLSLIPPEAVAGWLAHVIEETQQGRMPAAGQRFK